MVAESLAAMSAVVSQIQTIKDAVGSAIEARDAAVFNQKAIELTAQILAAQSLALTAQEAQTALLARERELEGKIADMENWNAKAAQYELIEVAPGCIARRAKTTADGSAAIHYVCADCFEDRRLAYLQMERRRPGHSEVLCCNHCGSEIIISGERGAEHPKRRGRR